ncbi:hypothetical protein F5888DRAFT_1663240 [Russula emetica]|nr:hypothetical protein F5888DRAFT_1663240 [Russula emetica]
MSSASASVQASLTLLAQTCALSIAAIRTNSTVQQLPFSSLRTDFISLLSVIYSNTTKLSIALNPSNPTYSATTIPLKDLITHSSTLASNASSFLPNVHGRALTAEVHSTATDVLTALQELAHAHLSLLIKSASKDDAAISTSKTANDTYLAKTGVVHELITQAKADHPQGLSRTNLIAVRKRWGEHSGLVADAAAVLEIEADPPDDDADADADADFDDGWGDLSDPGKQSPEQVELAKKIYNVVERTSTLFDDIRRALLSPPRAPAQPPPNALLDDLLDSAPPLVAAVDELATHIYDTPDEPSPLDEGRDSFARALTPLSSAVKNFWKGKEDSRPASEWGSRTYFIEQFAQLNVAVEAVQWTNLT